MILTPIDINNDENFSFTTSHQSTWVYYLKQYVTVFNYLLTTADKKRSKMNCQHMSVMFIFRHTVELFLKAQLYNKNGQCLNTHKLTDLYNLVKELLPKDFKEKIDVLNWDGDGSEFRYAEDKSNNSFFSGEELSTYSSFAYFVSAYNNIFPENIIATSLTYDRRIEGELKFYTRESRNNQIVRTHYDTTLSMLVNAIDDGDIKLEEIYLPLLFLIRHSVELAIKNALQLIGDDINQKKKKRLKSEHSILALHNMFSECIDEAVKKIPNDTELYAESVKYIKLVTKTKKIIEYLDSHSYSSRFPFDNKRHEVSFEVDKTDFKDLIQSYTNSDTYLTWCVDVLAGEGYLELGDDVLHNIFGY